MPDSPLAREIREFVYNEFRQHDFRIRRSTFSRIQGKYVAFSSLQKSYWGESFYLNIGYIVQSPYPVAERMTVERCNIITRANYLAPP
jgi:hypothetical protein